MPNVLKSWSLNLLEPSGPVQACNGIAFLLYTTFTDVILIRMISVMPLASWFGIFCAQFHPVNPVDLNRQRYNQKCRSQWPLGLRRRSAAARLLGLWVWIPLGVLMCVSCECCVLSGRDLCVGLITFTEESYRVWCVWVWWRILDNEEALAHSAVAPW